MLILRSQPPCTPPTHARTGQAAASYPSTGHLVAVSKTARGACQRRAFARTRQPLAGVCRRQDRMLLARYVSPDRTQRHWTLPGGKDEHSEDPCDAVVREVAEETGYQVEIEQLLDLNSHAHHVDWDSPAEPSCTE